MLSSPYGGPFHWTSSPSVPSEPPSNEEYTMGAPFGGPLSPPAHDESPSDDEGVSFSPTTTVEICSSDGSSTFISSGSGHSQSIFVASNSHTKPVLGPGVTADKIPSPKNKSPSGAFEQSSVFKLKFFNRSLLRLVPTPKQPSLHSCHANGAAPPRPPPLSTFASSVDLTRAEVLTLPSIWLISPTPTQPAFSSPVVLEDERTPPSASSSPSPVMIYEPTTPSVARTYQYLEMKPLPTIPIVSQRHSVIAVFVRRLGNAIGFKRESVQSPHRHNHVYDKPGVDKRARLHSQLSPRIQTYSFETAPNGHFTTTKQKAGRQSNQRVSEFGGSETITDGGARHLSSFQIGPPNCAPRTGGGNVTDLQGIVTNFVRAENAKRSGIGSAVGSGRQGSGSGHPPSLA